MISVITIVIIAILGSVFGVNILSDHDNNIISNNNTTNIHIVENGQYCTVDEVAAYIKEYHKLPSNYITKKEAQKTWMEWWSIKRICTWKEYWWRCFYK